jgi:xanthine dehydrogenase molybdenum-binding subunit
LDFPGCDGHTADLNCGQTTARRGTVLAANAVIDAAKKLRADLDKGLTPAQLIGRKYRGDFVCDWTTALENTSVEDPVTHITYGFATQVAILDDEGRVSKIIAAHDAGRVINPT